MVQFSNPTAYELWMGRWSKRLAPLFVTFANLSPGARLLDLGSGTGVLSVALLEGVTNATVVGIDPAESYIAFCRSKIADERVQFQIGDALDIPFEEDSFDATLSLLILQELSNASLALAEMRRVTKVGGIIAASQWDFAQGMPMLALFWETALEVVPNENTRRAAADCMKVSYPDESALRRLWQEVGLIEIETERQAVDMSFACFEDYWAPFRSNVSSASSFVGTLDAEKAGEIQDRLRAKVGCDKSDQSFCLKVYAWAIRGKVPRH